MANVEGATKLIKGGKRLKAAVANVEGATKLIKGESRLKAVVA